MSTNQQRVRALYPSAYLGGYFSNYRIYSSQGGKLLGRGRLQREAWADAAANIKEAHATPLP